MKIFDYSFFKGKSLYSNLFSIVSSIVEIKTSDGFRKENNQDIYIKLESIARVQSIKESNAIEGIVTTDERIHEIVNNSSAPLNHSEMEIAGYRDCLDYIHKNHEYLDFDENTVLHLYLLLIPENKGLYKKYDNTIQTIFKDGRREERWKPISAKNTKEAMNQLYLAYIDARSDSNINNLLLIPCVILDFLCIHPFADGNGRMSRLLSLLLLYKEGYNITKYISFEEQINKKKSYYYDALKNSSTDWHENKNDYNYFIENFLSTLQSCYQEMDKRFTTVSIKKVFKNKRIENILLTSILPVSKKDISERLVDVSVTTIEAVLGDMVKKHTISKIGSGRNTKYLRNKK